MRYYSSTATVMALTAPYNEIASTIIVDTVLGLPAQTPFTLVLDVGLSTEEIVTVTGVSGTSLTVTRGEDGSTAVAHSIGAVVRHMMTARDLREPAAHVGGAANVHGLGATASVVGTDTTQTLTNKTVNCANNTVVGVPQASVTGLVADIAALVSTDEGLAGDIAALVLADTDLVADIAGLSTVVDGKAPASHTHIAADVTNFSAAIDALIPWATFVPLFDAYDLTDYITAAIAAAHTFTAVTGRTYRISAGLIGTQVTATGIPTVKLLVDGAEQFRLATGTSYAENAVVYGAPVQYILVGDGASHTVHVSAQDSGGGALRIVAANAGVNKLVVEQIA